VWVLLAAVVSALKDDGSTASWVGVEQGHLGHSLYEQFVRHNTASFLLQTMLKYLLYFHKLMAQAYSGEASVVYEIFYVLFN
jgi:hypothetical protein